MGKMTEQQKIAISEAIIAAVEAGDEGALGRAIAAAVVSNNPKLAPWGSLLGAALGATLARFDRDYGADAEGVSAKASAPWYRRMLPW